MDLFATCLGKRILSHILNLTVIRKFPNMPLVFISVMLCFSDFKQYFCAHFLSFEPIFFLLVIPRLFLRYHVVDVSTLLLGITDELLISRLLKSFAISSLILNILSYAVIFFFFLPLLYFHCKFCRQMANFKAMFQRGVIEIDLGIMLQKY